MAEWSFDRKISEDTSPPFEDLVELRSAFEIIEEVGPRFDSGKRLQQLDDDLYDGLRLRTVIDGHPMNWISGFVQAKSEILKKIPVGNHSALEVVAGFNALKAARADLPGNHDSPVLLSKEHRIEQGLVFVRSKRIIKYVTGKPTSYYYAQISCDWARFFIQLNALDSIVTNLTLRCLREGRAICLTQEASGWELQVPRSWDAKSELGGHAKSQFLLTCDLPEAWHFNNMGAQERSDRKLKTHALRWLHAKYRRLDRSQERLTNAEVMNELSAKFGMKIPKVRGEVWKEAPISNWRS